MPGFLIHLSEARIILDSIEKNLKTADDFKEKIISIDDFKKKFTLGTIIPDGYQNKHVSHLHPEKCRELITKYPDMPYILSNRFNQFNSPYDLGILAHLHMDYLYVTKFWPGYFGFFDKFGNTEYHISHIEYVKIFASHQKIPLKDFFSEKWFYGDYDISNGYLKGLFSPEIPDFVTACRDDININECKDYDESILEKGLIPVKMSRQECDIPDTKVFPCADIADFIKTCAEDFIRILTNICFRPKRF